MFSYSEPLSVRFLNPLPEELHISGTTCSEALLIRLLTGTIDIHHITDNRSYKARTNYSNLTYVEQDRISSRPIRDCFDSENINKIGEYLLSNNRSNKSFNETLLLESTHLVIAKSNKNYLSAFVHLYRLLEFISYSFPLFHTSKSNNYFGSFTDLQKYFTDSGGELKFLIRFVNNLFENKPEILLLAEFNIPGTSTEIRSELYRSIKRILGQKQSYITYNDSLYQFHVGYKNLIDLIVFIRNRYFHFSTGTGMKNFKSSEIIDPNLFFEIIIDNSFNWISRIYFEILTDSIS